jgi:hypothetical protein
MPTAVQEGTTTPTVNTETTLGSAETSNKNLLLTIDAANMVNGDTLEVRIYTIVRSGGTEQVAYARRYKNVQAEPIKYSVPVPADISFRASIKQTTGTARAFPWKIIQP